MGLVGGPHCLAMCAAPCHAVIQGHGQVVQLQGRVSSAAAPQQAWSTLQFHAGRLAGYGVLGGLAAWAMEQVAWFSDRSAVLHPLWVLMHLAILAWGGVMLVQGQQPLWLERAGRKVWAWVQPVLALRGGALLAGMAWALMPCGLLYSAILVAALSATPWIGAVSMVTFAGGSALWLVAAPYAWRWLSGQAGRIRAEWGPRAAGLMLVAVALWALWMDLVYKPSLWCR